MDWYTHSKHPDDWKRHEEEYYEDEEPVSNCCGAAIKWGDICTNCGEHCEPMEAE